MKFRTALFLAGALALTGAAARAEESPMKICADKWQAAKSANATGNLTYLQFSSKCRADLKAQPAAPAPAAPASSAPAPAAPAPSTAQTPPPSAAKPDAAPAPAGAPVFPAAINPAYKSLTPGKAIMKSCVDQYNANKATGGNAGLKWIEKGGGYYSLCNKKLKG